MRKFCVFLIIIILLAFGYITYYKFYNGTISKIFNDLFGKISDKANEVADDASKKAGDEVDKRLGSTLASKVKVVASEAEKQFSIDEVMGSRVNEWKSGIKCEDVAMSSVINDCETCIVKMKDHTAYVTCEGKGLYKNYKVVDATKSEATGVRKDS